MEAGSGFSSPTDLERQNARMRRVLEILHDSVCPVDSERYPEHGPEVCRVFLMTAAQQDQYWYRAVRNALRLDPPADVPDWDPESRQMVQIGTRADVKH